MTEKIAACRCGAATARFEGEPIRVSVCHCLACQRRTGSAFGAQARFPADRVRITGDLKTFERIGDSGARLTDRFCPECGSTLVIQFADQPDVLAIPLGAFADPGFSPGPVYSIYETRKHAWVAILGEGVEHMD